MRLESELNEALRSGRQILGATQEAGALVIEELLRGQPYRLDIIGRQSQIDASIMRHEVSGCRYRMADLCSKTLSGLQDLRKP